jgi:hypothetical protein
MKEQQKEMLLVWPKEEGSVVTTELKMFSERASKMETLKEKKTDEPMG